MTKTTKFIYISDPLFQTVKDSQVLNWLEVLGKRNISFDLILITRLSYLIKSNKLRKNKISKAKTIVPGKVRQIFILKNRDLTKISDIIITTYLLIYLFYISVIQKRPVIIQTRMGEIGNILRFISKVYKNVNVIFDYRGAGAEEYINGLNYKDIKEVKDRSVISIYQQKIAKQQQFLLAADHVFCVSNKLREYAWGLLENIPFKKEKMIVVPGCADEEQFFLDPVTRKDLRKEFELENKHVLIYTGKLNLHWHKKEAIFELVAEVIKISPRFYFMCITPEIDLAKRLSKDFNIPDSNIWIQHIEYDKIPNYLNLADTGIILRDDIKTNHVASPTKIPEYLLTGLPVIISKNIGDYSDFINQFNLGIVYDEKMNYTDLAEHLLSTPYDRTYIAETGKKYYAKQRLLDGVIDIYNELVK